MHSKQKRAKVSQHVAILLRIDIREALTTSSSKRFHGALSHRKQQFRAGATTSAVSCKYCEKLTSMISVVDRLVLLHKF